MGKLLCKLVHIDIPNRLNGNNVTRSVLNLGANFEKLTHLYFMDIFGVNSEQD